MPEGGLPIAGGDRPPQPSRNRQRQAFVWALSFMSLAIGLMLVSVITSNLGLDEKEVVLGATFSKHYAEQLGLDWKETYLAGLDDLGIRSWRIPAYWDDLEPEPYTYDFSNLDWLIDQASQRNSRIILAVGRKLPRWPECHVPDWTKSLPEEIVRKRLLLAIEETVKRYKDNPAVAVWQVENEPFFPFGDCPKADPDFLKQEIGLVKSMDSRPVVITESGELSTWVRAANMADILGISTYRVVWSRFIGHFYWPITPKNYRQRAAAVKALVRKIIVSELQAEPWTTEPIQTVPIGDQLQIMNPSRLELNVVFARRMGFPEAYLWGEEWWYWLKAHGHPEMWATAKAILQTAPKLPPAS